MSDVFISAKSEDYKIAREIYKHLEKSGIDAFFSEVSLSKTGKSDYREVIDDFLDRSKHMIVVTTSKANVMSLWVKAEWSFFVNEQRSGRKNGNILVIVPRKFNTKDLPPSLRYNEVLCFDDNWKDNLIKYVHGNEYLKHSEVKVESDSVGNSTIDVIPEKLISSNRIKKIAVACDAGMGSSAMGASKLKYAMRKAGLDVLVFNTSIAKLTDDIDIVITHYKLAEKAKRVLPKAIHISISDFIMTSIYNELTLSLSNQNKKK